MHKRAINSRSYLTSSNFFVPGVCDIYNDEWWKLLKHHNRKSLQKRQLNNTIPWFILRPVTVQTIFSISKNLHQPTEVRYLTVEIFDRFMTQHYLDLHSYIWNKSDANAANKRYQWSRVIERVKGQVMLRIMSCMQLASKQVNICKSIPTKIVMDLLKKARHNFTLQSIVTSERRVFQTIQCKIPIWHPMKYVEHLLMALQIDLDFELLYSVSIFILDITYIQHEDIYSKLFHHIVGRWDRTPKERNEFLSVECDNIYLACAVISCAATITAMDPAAVTNKLQLESQIPCADIQALSGILQETVLSSLPT